MRKISLRYGDIVIIALVFALAALLAVAFAKDGSAEYFYIKTDMQTFEYPLELDARYTVVSNGITLTLEVADGKVAVVDSECDDKICVKTGRIEKLGESIVCLPARTIVGIKDSEVSDHADAIVG